MPTDEPVEIDAATRTVGGRARAAALIRRAASDGYVFLLVSASTDSSRLVLPAGKVDPGETPEDTVTRECREEAGAVVKPVCRLGRYAHRKGSGVTHPTVVLLTDWEAWTRQAENRRRVWKSPAELCDPGVGLQPDLVALLYHAMTTESLPRHAA